MSIQWSEIFEYSEESPSGLVWCKDRLAGFGNGTVNAFAGDVAGSVDSNGYWLVYVSEANRKLSCHRIIWEIFNGEVPEKFQIDHIDGERHNNRIENLRVVSGAVNARNQKLRKDNTSGIQGVYWNTNPSGNTYSVARWNSLDGKTVCKYFSVEKYGEEKALDLAVKAREEAIAELNKNGAGYSKRHGENYVNA